MSKKDDAPVQPSVKASKEPTLVCFDFDQTMVKGHFHSALNKQGVLGLSQNNGVITNGVVSKEAVKRATYNPELVKTEANKLLDDPDRGLKNPEELAKTFRTLLDQGHKIAITSFTKYPDAISEALKRLNLTEKEQQNIAVIGGFPPGYNPKTGEDPGKKYHIEEAMKIHGITNPANVMLIDDAPHNIKLAKEAGMVGVEVSKSPTATPEYLNTVRLEAEKMKGPIEITPPPISQDVEKPPVEPIKAPDKANELNQQITGEVQKLVNGPLSQDQLLAAAELSQSVAHISSKDDVSTLTLCLNEVVKTLSPEQAKPIIDLVDKYHKDNPTKQALVSPVLAPIKANDFLRAVIKDLGGSSRLDDFQMQKVAELTSSLKNIGDPESQKRFNTALEEFVKIAPEQANSFIGRIEEFHKNEPEKQSLVTPALEPFKVVGLNQELTGELEKLAGKKLTEPELLTVGELSQSVGYIKSKDDVGTLTLCLNEVVKNLSPEQAKPILDLVEKYHQGNPEKQELVSSVLKNVTLKKEPEIEVARDSLGSASVDEITQAIRDEVITKQQAYLQGEIAKIMSPENGTLFSQKTPEEVQVFLATPEGKDMVKLIMGNKEAQLAMNKIEVDGYKKVHETFKDSFKNVGWDQEPGTKVRIAEIKNEAGEKIASLKETTIDAAPTKVTLEDGTTRDIKSYRQIDFPLKLDDGKGPAHLSMAVKDENGRNISAKDAVYFTAHYDDDGKLTEVSSPVPVKFMGDGDDAIGYIERNGKVYTLPVTQGKYKEMMQEVAINNGLGVNVGQSVDSVKVAPLTVEPVVISTSSLKAVEQPVIKVTVDPTVPELDGLKKSGPVAIDPNALQMSKIIPIDPVPKPGPDQAKPLTDSQKFEAELQAKKKGLKPIPKTGTDQAKPLTDSQKFEAELEAKKKGLNKTDLGAEIYGYDKLDSAKKVTTSPTMLTPDPKLATAEEIDGNPKGASLLAINIKDIPPKAIETKTLTTMPAPEMGVILKVEQPTVSVAVESNNVVVSKPTTLIKTEPDIGIITNHITGEEVSPAVMHRVQEIRQVLDTSLPRTPEVNNGEIALKMLKDVSPTDALTAISTAIGKGDAELVKAMMDVINKPPEGAKIPQVGKVALTKVYTDQIHSTKDMDPKLKAQVQRAAGAIADKAGVNHAQQVALVGPKQTTSQGR